MRNAVRSLLQLRPKMTATPRNTKAFASPHAFTPHQERQGEVKGASPSPKPKAEWCTTYKGREVCRRYQTGSCTNDQCPFAHVCAIVGLPGIITNTREIARILDRHRIGQPCCRRGPHAPFLPLHVPVEAALTPALPYARRSEPSAPHTSPLHPASKRLFLDVFAGCTQCH